MRRLRITWRPDPRDVVLVLGLLLLGAGLAMIYVPAALIVVGAILVWSMMWPT